MSDDLPKIVNGNFLKHLHHFCISDDQGFSFLVHNTIKLCQEEDFNIFLKYFSFNKNIENDRFRCCPYCYYSFSLFSRSDAAEEKLAQTSSILAGLTY
jgi:hypothetical protein